MLQIKKPSDNMGGLLKIWAVPSHVYSINATNVSFTDTSNICEIYCTPGTIEESEEQQVESQNIFYKTVISGFIPKDSAELRTAIMNMQRKPYVIIYRNGNGEYKLAGTNSFPLKLSSKLSSGKAESDLAGYSIAFSGDTISPAEFISDPTLVLV